LNKYGSHIIHQDQRMEEKITLHWLSWSRQEKLSGYRFTLFGRHSNKITLILVSAQGFEPWIY